MNQRESEAFEAGRRKGRQEGMALGALSMTGFLIVMLLTQRWMG